MTYEVAGKFFLKDKKRHCVKGVTFGPYPPNREGVHLPEREAVDSELEKILSAGLNTIRLYEIPPKRFLDKCVEVGVGVILGIPWTQHVDFISAKGIANETRDIVKEAVKNYANHPAVFAFVIGNEIESSLVRWMGPKKVRDFLEELIDLCHEVAPDALVTYATYPTTEYLVPRNVDFVTFNLYLEDEESFRKYLRRLQLVAGDKPLLLGEFGFDSKAEEGLETQGEILDWSIKASRELGLAGHVVFAWSDLWFRGGNEVTGWDFGLNDRSGKSKPALARVRNAWESDLLGEADQLTFSVVVCTYNGVKTLGKCLDRLKKLDPAPMEILVVDDGSTLDIKKEVEKYVGVTFYRLEENSGLSYARNYGAKMAEGDIVAYIDDDAFAFEDWLEHLAVSFRDPNCAAAGGPNIPPPDSSWKGQVMANVLGRPTHVMFDDIKAEHLPGCNLAVRRVDWLEVGGFDPRFRSSGDDVDFCWRLIDQGREIHFSPGAVVWHLPRESVRGYLKQQAGYGNAEKLLHEKHAHRFVDGKISWHGIVYSGPIRLESAMMYFGRYGEAPYQGIVYGTRDSNQINNLKGTAGFFVKWLGKLGQFYRGKKRGNLNEIKISNQESSKMELTFWSEENVGKEILLWEICEELKDKDWRVESGDGWQNWDFRFQKEHEVILHAVSEYHGGEKIKTRIRLEGQEMDEAVRVVESSANKLGLVRV